MTVYVVLFHPPPEIGGRSRVSGVYGDRMAAALHAEARIAMARSEIGAKRDAEQRPELRQWYRTDHTEDEMRAWVEVVEKRVACTGPCPCGGPTE